MLSSGEITAPGIPQSSLVGAFAISPTAGLVTPAVNPPAAEQSRYVGECASKGFQHPVGTRLPSAPFGTPTLYLAGRGRGRGGAAGGRGVGGAGKPGAPSGARPKDKPPFSAKAIDAILRRMEHSPEWYEPMAALSLLTTVMITQQLDRTHEDRALDILWKFVLRPHRAGPPSDQTIHSRISLAYRALVGQHNLSDRERIGEILADFRRRKAELGKRHVLFIDVVEDEARGIFSPRLLPANVIPPELSLGGLILHKIPIITDVRTRAVRRAAVREIVKQLSKNDKLMGISEWMMYQYYLQILLADPDPVNRHAAIDAHEVMGRRLWSVIGISDIDKMKYLVTEHLSHTSALAWRIRLPHVTEAFDKAIVAFKAGYKLGSDEFFSD